MALQAIELDTLDWDQMTTAIRTRIVPDSKGKWTLHAPVDPGVTLLELFAWLLDQRIYWMDQVPTALSLAVLGLLGESPLPAKAALTVLQLSDGAIPPRSFPTAPAGTAMQLGDSNPPIIFTTNDDLTLLPVTSIAITVNGVDHTNDLQQCRLVPLNAPQVEILLSLSGKLPAAASAKLPAVAGQFFSLMIDLETSGDVLPEWSAEAVPNVPAPATLTWSYTNTSNTVTPFASVHEGTGGLRRSGTVRLALPADWQPEASGAYKIVLGISGATFTFSPLLRRLKANMVLAKHASPETLNPDTSQWLPLPGNVVSLNSLPIEDTVQVQIAEDKWLQVSDLSLSGPTDRVFLVSRARSEISFGDGLTGRLPLVSSMTVSFQTGGGLAGNVGQGSPWVGQGFLATNLAPGDGGAETETLAAAITRSTTALNERNRAVSKADYETLARTTPGVAFQRAYAAVGFHPDFPGSTVPGAITVFVVPYAPRVETDGDWASDVYDPAPVPDQGALQAAQAWLNGAKLIGGEVFVCPPVYRKVWLTLTVAVDAPLPASLREAIISGLHNFLDPLVGGDAQEGWLFGDPLRPSALLRVAQGVLGTAGDVQGVAVSLDSPNAAAAPCKDVTIQPYQLVNLVHVDLETRQRAVQSGGLR
jgi:predicted phage baseplate assembly protein